MKKGILNGDLNISYETEPQKSYAYKLARGCHAQCCVRSETGSKSWYMLF